MSHNATLRTRWCKPVLGQSRKYYWALTFYDANIPDGDMICAGDGQQMFAEAKDISTAWIEGVSIVHYSAAATGVVYPTLRTLGVTDDTVPCSFGNIWTTTKTWESRLFECRIPMRPSLLEEGLTTGLLYISNITGATWAADDVYVTVWGTFECYEPNQPLTVLDTQPVTVEAMKVWPWKRG